MHLPCQAAFSPSVPVHPIHTLHSLFIPSLIMTYPKQPSRTSRSTRNFTPRASLKGNAKSKFYAVRNGRGGISGIFDNWQQTQAVVSGVRGAKHKSFRTLEEAQAFLGSDATPAQTMVQPRPYLSDNQTGTSIVPSIPTASTDLSCPDVANQNAVQSLPSLPVHDAATQLARAAPEPCPDSPVSLSVYTDGACTKNGKPGAKAGYGVFFGDDNPYNLSEPLEGHPTNQRAEMTAALEAMRIVLNHGLVARGGRVIVHSDSQVRL